MFVPVLIAYIHDTEKTSRKKVPLVMRDFWANYYLDEENNAVKLNAIDEIFIVIGLKALINN